MSHPIHRCSRCGSKKIFEDKGIHTCHSGHVQVGGQQTVKDDAYRGRVGKNTPQKGVKDQWESSIAYAKSGKLDLYLMAWQHVLWKQCYALIHEHGYPSDLWGIVRELWALRLHRLVARLESQSDISVTGENTADTPHLVETIATAYLGMIILRHPTSLAQMHEYVVHEQVCYIRAIRFVPCEIRDQLASQHLVVFNANTAPNRYKLQQAVYQIMIMYQRDFVMSIPPLNWPSVLVKYIQKLALPLEVYSEVKDLASVLGYDFSYATSDAEHRSAIRYPEAQLMALVVVVTRKMSSLEWVNVERPSSLASEPTAVKMDGQVWLEPKKEPATRTRQQQIKFERTAQIDGRKIEEMPMKQLDRYMDLSEQVYITKNEIEHRNKEILDMFPLQEMAPPGTDINVGGRSKMSMLVRLGDVQAEHKPSRVNVDDNEVPAAIEDVPPRQQSQSYPTLEAMSEVEAAFHKAAAEVACVSAAVLQAACARTQGHKLREEHERRRAELLGKDQ